MSDLAVQEPPDATEYAQPQFGCVFDPDIGDTTRTEPREAPTTKGNGERRRFSDATLADPSPRFGRKKSAPDLEDPEDELTQWREAWNYCAQRADLFERESRYWLTAAKRVIKQIEDTLREHRDEGIFYGEVCANESAVATCKTIGLYLTSWLAAPPSGSAWAAFGEEPGGVSLVLRSDATDRRIDFRISPDGRYVSCVRIDENLRTVSVPVNLDDSKCFLENAAWVDGRR